MHACKMSSNASPWRSSSVTSFCGSAISNAVTEHELELDEVLDESHELLVKLSNARSLERTTLHLSPAPAAIPAPLLPSGSTPADLMGLALVSVRQRRLVKTLRHVAGRMLRP